MNHKWTQMDTNLNPLGVPGSPFNVQGYKDIQLQLIVKP